MINKAVIKKIESKLKQNHIILNVNSLSELSSPGMMSRIFSCDSNKGKLIIHLVDANFEQKRQKTYLKVKYVSDFLKNKKIPHANVLMAFSFDKKYFIVQELVKGKVMKDSKQTRNELYKILSKIHSIKMKGFGFLIQNNGILQGKYESWKEFLMKEPKFWLKNIYKNRIINKNLYLKYKKMLKSYILENLNKINCKTPRLIHGDMVNRGNVLVLNNKINAILDFEWAMSGDPAWEFSRKNQMPEEVYFKKISKRNFKERVKIYSPLFALGVSYSLSDKNVKLSKERFERFRKIIDKFSFKKL